MAGDWLKIEANTPEKPEVFEIAQQLKISTDEAFAKLFRVWRLFDQHTEDGNAVNVTPAYLDHVCGVTGFAKALREVGWLIGGEDGKAGCRLPNFDRHNGETAKKRALTAKRVAAYKKRSGNDEVTHTALPREEKRRDNPIPLSGAFLKFWGSWPKHPRKQSRVECWELWRKRDYDQQAEAIIAHVESLKQSQDWRKNNGEFIPAPLPYLRQQRWDGAELAEPEGKRLAV